MAYLSIFLVALVALEHIYIMVLEMFFWTKPRTIKTFATPPELAEKTTAMAANQGLYNGFLAAGLICGLLHSNAAFSFQIQAFFLVCIIIAAIYGALTITKKIIVMQGLPAALALLSICLF